MVKNRPANAGGTGDAGSIPGSGRSPGAGNGNPLQYSCLENSTGYSPWGHKESDLTEHSTGAQCEGNFYKESQHYLTVKFKVKRHKL